MHGLDFLPFTPWPFGVRFAGPLLAFGWGTLTVIVTIVLAILVYRDAVSHRRNVLGITPPVWILIVLVTSFIGAVGYWLMNRSSLAAGQVFEPPPNSTS